MKKFFFVTALTPAAYLSPLRTSLFDLYVTALNSQTYSNWEALLIGEVEKKEGNLTYVKTDAVTKAEKLQFAFQYLNKLAVKPDYIIRLDDDDLISPYVLERTASLEFDCYSDQYHTFYDLTSGATNQQKRDWLPNSIIHKYEHGLAPFGENQNPLFTQDHSKAWHAYYSGKNVVFAPKNAPVYLRILSPGTITSRLGTKKEGTVSSVDLGEYKKYLIPFGRFSTFGVRHFIIFHAALISIWENYSGQKIFVRKNIFKFFNW